jgi:hypothetical protein
MNRRGSILLAALCLCLSCTTGTDGEEGVPHDQSSVLGTLLLFEDVWNSGDVDTYESLLDEDFLFYFDPMDVEYGLPESWDYEAEIQAFTNLFEAVGDENVDVTLDLTEVTEPEEGVDTYRVEEIPYEVRVLVHTEYGDILYPAYADLDVELTKVDDGWVITRWWDRVSYRLLAMEVTWGEIKAVFY